MHLHRGWAERGCVVTTDRGDVTALRVGFQPNEHHGALTSPSIKVRRAAEAGSPTSPLKEGGRIPHHGSRHAHCQPGPARPCVPWGDVNETSPSFTGFLKFTFANENTNTSPFISHNQQKKVILYCFWMGFLLFLPAYMHSPGGIIVFGPKKKGASS